MTTRPPRLGRLRKLARAVLLFERGWPALWPSVAILGGLACAALLGLVERLPPAAHALLLLGAIAAAGWLGWARLRRVTPPDNRAADRRLERASGLRHRPLGVLADVPAAGTGEAEIWRAHVARVERSLGRLRVGLPDPGLARRDGHALRHLLVLGLVVGLGVAGADAPRRLLGLADLGFAPPVPPLPPKLDAWVTPPAYTGVAPLLLSATQPEVTVPAGSRLAASVSGGAAGPAGAPDMRLDGAPVAFQALDGSTWQAATELARGGTLLVRKGGTPIGSWELTVVDDLAPVVRWTAAPSAARGRVPQTRLPWQAEHPYGVSDLHAEFRLQARPDAPPLSIDVPLPGGAPRSAKGVRQADLTPNPWAGLPVQATLVARDPGGMRGVSEAQAFTLPERRFQHPAARAIVAVRKQLALRPDDRAPPLAALDGIAGEDALWSSDPGGYLNLRVIEMELAAARHGADGTPVIDAMQDRLWQLALHLEEESPARTAEALAQARKALRSALDQARTATQDQAKTKAEVQRRERELQQALQNHLQALRREAQGDPQKPPPPEALARQAQKALQDMQDATDAGRQEQAEQDQAALDQALDAMEQQRRDANATPRQKQRAEGRERGRKQMGVLQDLVRREGGLVDHAQARAQAAPAHIEPVPDTPPDTLPGAGSPSLAQTDAAEREHDARVQRALRRALGELMQQHGDLTGKIPEFLGQADLAMRDAQGALADRHDDVAADAQQRAIAALQEGGQAMSQQLARQFGRERGRQQGGGEPDQDASQGDEGDPTSDGQAAGPADGSLGDQGDSKTGRNVDPFGRALHEGENGATDGGDTAVPETMEQARTRAVQEELRRRGADRLRPQDELDYIGRLLDTP